MPNPANIVCLVIDRLHSGFVGAYGNTWIATPELDRLAAESFLFDRAVIDSPSLVDLYRAYWQGSHALVPATIGRAAEAESNLPRQLAAAGYFTSLVTDDPRIGELPLVGSFHEHDELDHPTGTEIAPSIDETHLAGFFARSIERLAKMRGPFCLWLHTGSLGQTWDAPLEFRNQYPDEDDPRPPESAAVPCKRLPRDYDPDELLGTVHSYAGQVSLLDVCIGSLVEALAGSPFAESTLLTILSARGFPLGEHGRVGPVDEALYGELTQIPWLLRFPDGQGRCARTQALVQPADLFATLAEWCGLPRLESPSSGAGRSLMPLVEGTSEAVRDRACAVVAPQERAIVTPAWYLRMQRDRGQGRGGRGQETWGSRQSADANAPADSPVESNEVRCELFVKPDDRFEVNEVGDRCRDCVVQLQEAFAQFQQSCESAESPAPPVLTEILLNGLG